MERNNFISVTTSDSAYDVLENSNININTRIMNTNEFIKLIMKISFLRYQSRILISGRNELECKFILEKWGESLIPTIVDTIFSTSVDIIKDYSNMYDKVCSLGYRNSMCDAFLSNRNGLIGIGYKLRASIFNASIKHHIVPDVYNTVQLNVWPGMFIDDLNEEAAEVVVNDYSTLYARMPEKPKNPDGFGIVLYKHRDATIICTKNETVRVGSYNRTFNIGDVVDLSGLSTF